ncbi:MAG: histidine phosphatase family protein [marine benthic group bacterium]|nr:histidine phosphatase family protein [Candidatus Benthicola marisminoris]
MSRSAWNRAVSLAIAALVVAAAAPAQETTTVIVVRHAEKVSEERDAVLSEAGWKRAAELQRITEQAGVKALFASQFARAQLTLQPISENLGLEIQVHDAEDSRGLARRILADHAGQVVIVSGHSNTVPEIVAALGAPEPTAIEDWDYDDLFVVTVGADGNASALHLSYTEHTFQPEPSGLPQL